MTVYHIEEHSSAQSAGCGWINLDRPEDVLMNNAPMSIGKRIAAAPQDRLPR